MNLSSDSEHRFETDGLQEIRSWASRSPEAARPGFRSVGGPRRLKRPSRLAASLLAAPLLLIVFAGYRFLHTSQGEPESTVVLPKQVEVAPAPAAAPTVHEAPAVAEIPAPEALPDSPKVHSEPLEVRAAVLQARSATGDRRPQKAVLRSEPLSREPQRTSQGKPVVVDEDAFESESAVLLSAPAAEYPDAARETGAWAKITVGFTIDETGIVRDPKIESSWVKGEAPEAAFVEAALAAARTARFEPARERGIPTSSWSTLTFTFEAGPL